MAGGLPISCTDKEIQTFITWWLCHCSCLPSGFPSWVSPLSSSFQSTTHSTPKVNSLKQCFHQIHLTRTHKESILILSFLTSVPKMGKWTDCDLPIQSPVVRTPAPSEPPGHHIHLTSLISFQTNKKPKKNQEICWEALSVFHKFCSWPIILVSHALPTQTGRINGSHLAILHSQDRSQFYHTYKATAILYVMGYV